MHVIAEHVAVCESCALALGELDRPTDELFERLSSLEASGVSDEVTLPRPLLDAALTAMAEGAELVVDPGRRMARALRDGVVRVGRFELLSELGSGSFGHVFRARDTQLERIVAVKVCRSHVLGTDEDRQRFLREARSAAQLKHQNIVALFEAGETDDGTCYLVSEYIAGQTLEHRIRNERCDPRVVCDLLLTVSEALHYAHTRGIIHRDIKPANIMIDSNGQPHVMDFGLAKRDAGEVTVTRAGDVMGTPAYMSPEMARGEGHFVDARSDVFSLGVMMYELLTGERPFRGQRRMVLMQVLEEDPRPPRRLNDRIPRDLETICLKAMAKSPARRYATAGDLACDQRRFLAGEPIAARPIGAPERVWRWSRRNPVVSSLTVAVVLGLAGGLLHLSRLSGHLMEQTALDSAAMQAEMLERMNALYSIAVATPMHAAGVDVTHDFVGRAGAIPLPATFTIALGEDMRKSEYGMQVRLYSDYPFTTRTDGGPRDEFERAALMSLRNVPADPVYRFEHVDGRYALRYATARLMQASCIGCHNSHPASTKTDWKVGDVRGVLEIIHPLERDLARTRAGLRGTFVWIIGIASACLISAVSVAVFERLGRR